MAFFGVSIQHIYLYKVLGNISLFSKSLSMDNLPGPDRAKLIAIDISNKSTSKPPCPIKPFPDLTMRMAHIISMVNNMDVILVTKPTINKVPPTTSNIPISSVKSEGMPTEAKKPWVPSGSSNFGIPCNIKAIPAIILIGNGANDEIFSRYIL